MIEADPGLKGQLKGGKSHAHASNKENGKNISFKSVSGLRLAVYLKCKDR